MLWRSRRADPHAFCGSGRPAAACTPNSSARTADKRFGSLFVFSYTKGPGEFLHRVRRLGVNRLHHLYGAFFISISQLEYNLPKVLVRGRKPVLGLLPDLLQEQAARS